MLALCYTLTILFKLISYVALSFIVLVIGLKLWLEPTKGVCKCKTTLENKVALITGGNSGIGLETARDLARRGARVIIASRNDKKSKEAVEDIIATTGNHNVEYKHLDLSKFTNVRKVAEDINKSVGRLDILVNNAGCGIGGGVTEDGIDNIMQINYLGPFLLTNLLMDKLIESRPSRIVIVSSFAHHVSYFDPEDLRGLKYLFFGVWFRYANSKLCNNIWTRALSDRLPNGVTVNCLHPGVVYTNIFDTLHPVLKSFVLMIIKCGFFKSPQEGAHTTIHLCVSPDLENVSGKYFCDCKVYEMSRKAYDEVLVEKVWNDSIKLISNK
ncbi:retinol dehydrogenase 12-like [Plodia interpunctella]|uniref:retinol dehydrogenase 12-like n=1 Tax=Plodia interpunctella TaxID=58824 RepID=UPI002368C744|nr:retinol dehydrogenase 12-like [Plodia interpunctella]